MKKTHTVICILEAKVGKEELLKRLLANVAEPSRSEAACLECGKFNEYY